MATVRREADAIPLSQFGVLVAQLESIAASAPQQPPDALLCFDLLSELVAAIEDEPKETIQQWQRKCEDALYSLLILGARCPVRRLASLAMGRVIGKGDGISIYSRVSSLQGWLADGKRSEPLSCAGVASCLGELYRLFGQRITSGLTETTNIAGKLMKFYEDFVRKAALQMLENALEGCGGSGPSVAYSEAYRIIMRVGVSDKSFIVRLAAARCLKTFANIGGPGISEFENSILFCLKALDDPVSSVRDAFAEALGGLLALAMNPEAQVKQRASKVTAPVRKMEDGIQKHFIIPFVRASGVHLKDLRIGLTLSWVFFLQVLHGKYHLPDNELQDFALLVMDMLKGNDNADPQALACILYILRVGIADQLTESSQRSFLVFMGKKLESADCSPSMRVAALRILSYLLINLGEVPAEFKDILDNTVVAALSDSSLHVRIEAALTLRALAKVDPTCVGGLISYGMTTLHALRESGSFEKGTNLNAELNSLHGQATLLAALVSISPKLLLGYPARLPHSVFEVSKKMLTAFSRNPLAATVEKEAGWLLLASLVANMPKEELEDQVFDVLLLWAGPFAGNPETYFRQTQDVAAELCVLSAAIEALTAFIRSFVSPTVAAYNAVLLQPILAYLSGALFYISYFSSKQLPNMKSALALFTIRTLMAYQSIANPMAYENDHQQLIKVCITPFSDPSGYEESSSLRTLLDKKDACLGPWVPGSDWYEDELRAFDGGKDGLMPCVWDDNNFIFPQSESISKMLVNQMLSCFGIMFATQDNGGKVVLLNKVDQCLRNGKKQPWHMASVTNACVGLLAGLKDMLSLRQQTLTPQVLSTIQSIFQDILSEGEISSAQRRASCEGLGLLARLGSDIFTAKMTRSLLGELVATTDHNYIASICLSLGCIYRSAGGIALTTLVTSAVRSISSFAKSSNASLQLWSLHSLLLIIEAAGLSYVPQVQVTLFLAMEILLAENSLVDLRQEIGRLINAIVAVVGPELAPGSTFFSRCKSVIAEISSSQETSTLLESVRFTQQLVLFAPQAASVHSHVGNLLPTLSSRQPSLRHLAVSTLRHLIEKDPKAMIETNIEGNLFCLLDEETDSEIVSLVCSTITQWLHTSCVSCPSRWLSILHNKVLATSTRRIASENYSGSGNSKSYSASEGDTTTTYGEDDEDMISSSKGEPAHGSVYKRENHLRYRTRLFAAECLSCLPTAVGSNLAHFDISLARSARTDARSLQDDWLVLHLQELVSISYQISTIQFEGMQPIGVRLLCTIMDKFGGTADPDLPGHLLLEQFQAQLVSAVRSSISMSSGPLLLEAGLELATKILTSRIISGDQVALKRMYTLISRPLDEIKDLYYPSFAEWVACKIKIRLLTAHASIKHYVYQLLKEKKDIPDEYLQLVPLFSSRSTVLGKFWISVLKDFAYICFGLHSKFYYKPFLDGIQFAVVSTKVKKCIDEVWPLILQATALDAVPVNFKTDNTSNLNARDSKDALSLSGHSMVGLGTNEFHFLWGLSQLIMFQGQQFVSDTPVKILFTLSENRSGVSVFHGTRFMMASCEIAFTVLQSLSNEAFFSNGLLSSELCIELLQILVYSHIAFSRSGLVISLLSQIVHLCPDVFFELEDFTTATTELCLKYLIVTFQSGQDLLADLSIIAKTIACRTKQKMRWKLVLALMSVSHQWFMEASTNLGLSKIAYFLQSIVPSLKELLRYDAVCNTDDNSLLKIALESWARLLITLSGDCIKRLLAIDNSMNESCKLLAKILVFSLQETIAIARLVHETQCLAKNSENGPMLFINIFKSCTNSISDTIFTSNIQVQALGLHVLKTIAQRELAEASHGNNHSFTLLFIGESVGNLFLLIQQSLKEHARRESLAVTEDCLKLLFLIHTLAQASECQHHITVLLLEALCLVLSQSDGCHSKELSEVNTTARRMVSRLVQMPTAATQIKDAMLAMPVQQRLQIQDMIRASVTQGQMTMPVKMHMQPDLNTEDETRMQDSDSRQEQFDKHEINEEYNDEGDGEDDDWDAFQSFSADTASVSVIDSHNDRTGSEPTSFDDSSTVNSHQLDQNDAHDHGILIPNISEEANASPDKYKEIIDAHNASPSKSEVNDAQNASPGEAKEMKNLNIEKLQEESNMQPSKEDAVEDSNEINDWKLHDKSSEINEDDVMSTLHNSLQQPTVLQEERVMEEQSEAVNFKDLTIDKVSEVCGEEHCGDMLSASMDTENDSNGNQCSSHEVETQSINSDDADDSKNHPDDVPIAKKEKHKEDDGHS
ncbi:HEAT repeat-containing protein 5B isoform X6 [Canna indica]|uniref:HEAT repeat-containing protein 5B isoform X6 n=1 Tax=Canna indica TaxID=4628 RepID=A0AAQ3JSY2_9LILI|nr:HEAT repeat-containing protein 5B isoform X6 [Canna indica]